MPPALIIVDMQMGIRWPESGLRNHRHAESRIAALFSAWRDTQACVVHARHISRMLGSPFWPGQAGVEFQPELSPREGEHVFVKYVPDAFVNSGLE